MRASNIIYETPEGRPFWKLRPLQILVTLVMIILLAAVLLALVLTGPVVDAVAEPARHRLDRGEHLEHRQVAGAAGRGDR